MKKILLTALMVPALAFAQTFPSPTFNSVTIQNPLAQSSGGTGTNTATGTGSAVLSNAPALVSPNLGTPSAATLTNAAGLPLTTGVTGILPLAHGGTNAATATAATSNLQYLPSFTGAVAESVTAKFQHDVSVCDFGGCGQSGDVSSAFQDAINATTSGGGKIDVPDGNYTINTAPTWGTKSIFWNFGSNVNITGTQTTFPRMFTNGFQAPVGPWIQSQSTVASPTGGGIAALNAEMIQPSSYVGQSVAFYAGASGSAATTGSNVWAINNLVQANAGAVGFYQGDEIDVNDFAPAATVWGINISGVGTVGPTTGITINRVTGPNWGTGIALTQFNTGIQLGGGIEFPNSLISGDQTANGNDDIVLQRVTDTSPTGSFIRGVNAANSTNLFNIDVSGDAAFNGALSAGSITTSGAITPSAASGITGITNGGSAAAGSVGEFVSAVSGAIPLTSATQTNLTSITLTAGDWDVQGSCIYVAAASTVISNQIFGISTTSATLPAFTAQNAYTLPAGATTSLSAPTVRVSVASTTTVYLVGFLVFSTSTATGNGFIRARRVR